MSTGFDPYHTWLGIAPKDQPPHHYRLLGIDPFEDSPSVIEHAADRQMAHLRTFQAGKNSALSQKLLNEVATAKVCLLRPEKKAAYDAQLRELLAKQSAGEDTSSQLQALRAINEVLGEELARPVTQRKKPGASGVPWLAVGIGAAVLLAGVVAWSVMGQGKVAEKAERSPNAQAPSPKAQDLPRTESGSSTARTQPKAEEAKPAAPTTPSQDPRPKTQDLSKAESGSSAQRTPPRMEQPLAKAESGKPKAEDKSDDHREHRGTQREENMESSSVPSVVPISSDSQPTAKAESPKPKMEQPVAVPAASSPQPPIPNPQPPAARRPIPAAADQETARKAAQDLFRDDYAKAKKPAERADLARTILKKGQATRDPAAEQFVLLSLARDVAISADDDRLAGEAIDETSKSFEVDSLAMKADALAAIAKSARATLALHKTVCERALSLGQEALAQDRYELADTLVKLAYNEAGKVRDKDLVQRCRTLAKEQQEGAKAYSVVQEAFTTLKATPDDPAANLAVGKYLCFAKGDWSKGLVHLAKSNDAKLKPLADEERKVTPPEWAPAPGVLPPDPPPAAAALKLADSWWDAGQAVAGKQRDYILRHAGYWYHQSFGSDTTPLVATKINDRLYQIDKIRRQYPAPPLAIAPFDAREARLHQRRWADYLDMPWVMTNSIGMKFVLIPPGEFMMGSAQGDFQSRVTESRQPPDSWYQDRLRGESPQHRVRIGRAFHFAVLEITQREFQLLTGTNPSAFAAGGDRQEMVRGQDTLLHPVETVSWEGAVSVARRLSDRPAERVVRHTYRLPTEAEWEYACRAGSTTAYPWGTDSQRLPRYAWYRGNSEGKTHPSGALLPNYWGLFDMLGNVWEWNLDWLEEGYYNRSESVDPVGPRSATSRVIRGGSWDHSDAASRSAFRHGSLPGQGSPRTGFRLILN